MDLSGLLKEAPYIAALVGIVMIFVRSNEKRDDQWKAFLTEQRSQATDALGRLSAEITQVTQAVMLVNGEQRQHDSFMRGSLEQMAKARRKLGGKTTPLDGQ